MRRIHCHRRGSWFQTGPLTWNDIHWRCHCCRRMLSTSTSRDGVVNGADGDGAKSGNRHRQRIESSVTTRMNSAGCYRHPAIPGDGGGGRTDWRDHSTRHHWQSCVRHPPKCRTVPSIPSRKTWNLANPTDGWLHNYITGHCCSCWRLPDSWSFISPAGYWRPAGKFFRSITKEPEWRGPFLNSINSIRRMFPYPPLLADGQGWEELAIVIGPLSPTNSSLFFSLSPARGKSDRVISRRRREPLTFIFFFTQINKVAYGTLSIYSWIPCW